MISTCELEQALAAEAFWTCSWVVSRKLDPNSLLPIGLLSSFFNQSKKRDSPFPLRVWARAICCTCGCCIRCYYLVVASSGDAELVCIPFSLLVGDGGWKGSSLTLSARLISHVVFLCICRLIDFLLARVVNLCNVYNGRTTVSKIVTKEKWLGSLNPGAAMVFTAIHLFTDGGLWQENLRQKLMLVMPLKFARPCLECDHCPRMRPDHKLLAMRGRRFEVLVVIPSVPCTLICTFPSNMA